MKLQLLLALLLAAILTGCASTPAVVPLGQNTFTLHKAGDANAKGTALRDELLREAGDYCTACGLVFVPVSVQMADGKAGVQDASATVVFKAVKPSEILTVLPK